MHVCWPLPSLALCRRQAGARTFSPTQMVPSVWQPAGQAASMVGKHIVLICSAQHWPSFGCVPSMHDVVLLAHLCVCVCVCCWGLSGWMLGTWSWMQAERRSPRSAAAHMPLPSALKPGGHDTMAAAVTGGMSPGTHRG